MNSVLKRYACKKYQSNRALTNKQLEDLINTLRFSPSSVNSQPWHFFIIKDDSVKLKLSQIAFDFNAEKVKNCSAIIILTAQNHIDEDYLNEISAQENLDGRFLTDNDKIIQDKKRKDFIKNNVTNFQGWVDRNTYIALGILLIKAHQIGLDATPIEGFDALKLNQFLDLDGKNLHSLCMVSVGFSAEGDFNKNLKKSRLKEERVVTVI